MAQIVVTTGKRYTDIDGLACVWAYQEIPLQGALGILPGPLNQSIPQSVRRWLPKYAGTLKPGDYDFVITDVSEAPQLPDFVKLDHIIKIYDHHFGFEKYWEEKLGTENVHIEPVGACATLIWETYKNSPPLLNPAPLRIPHPHSISPLSANLLYTAIVSNTLNFKSSLTTDRDKQAFEELKPFTDLPDNWIAKYYLDQEQDIFQNPIPAVANDTKLQVIKGMTCAIGQMELWDSRNFLKEHQKTIESVLKNFNTETWLFTSPCISEGRNYIFTKNPILKDYLRQVLEVDFQGTDIGTTSKLWLRKEILKKIQ